MIVNPYKRFPEAPVVALLTDDGQIVTEHGQTINPEGEWPEGVRAWTSYDTARELIAQGQGEAVCWNNEEIHWRHARLDPDGWKPRPSDVHVIKLPFPDDQAETLAALARWRSWLASYGAAPLSTSGSAAWSLLRARLDAPLRTSEPFRSTPPLRMTVGGRQTLGPAGSGSFKTRCEQWDIPAAYASTLAGLHYGGLWYKAGTTLPDGVTRPLDWWAVEQRIVFARAKVRIPELLLGPLPRRPAGRGDPFLRLGSGCVYPTGCDLQGFWTLEELRAAEDAGCRILKVIEIWTHFAGQRQPFLPWWEAIEAGREAPGLAGTLAKMTGNALWGRFCMDGRYGRRTIRSKQGQKIVPRKLVFRGGQPPAHDLAEAVSGRVRAELYQAIRISADDLLSAHTDGVWIRRGPASLRLAELGWRRKQEAWRLDLLSPQTLRYWRRGQAETVMAGVPSRQADQAFEEAWQRHEVEQEQAAA